MRALTSCVALTVFAVTGWSLAQNPPEKVDAK